MFENKATVAVGAGLVGVLATLAFSLWICYGKIQTLSADNAELKASIQIVSGVLDAEVERNKNVAAWTAELARRDDERQEKFLGFQKDLAAVKKRDKAAAAVLDIVLPLDVLSGLRSFSAGGPRPDPGDSAGIFNFTNDLPKDSADASADGRGPDSPAPSAGERR